MPVVDEYGDFMTTVTGAPQPNYAPTPYTSQQAPLPTSSPYYVQAWAAPYASSSPTPNAPAAWSPRSGVAPTDAQFREWIIGSPEYKTRLEQLQQDYDAQRGYADRTKALQNDQYGAQVADADRAKRLREKQIKETLAGRGMLSSGQTAFELNDANYSYQTFLRDLDFQRKMRLAGEDLQESQRDTSLARNRYQALIEVTRYYRDLWWDPTTGRYVGQGGG